MKTRLLPWLPRARCMIFYAPPDDGGGSGSGSGDAPSGDVPAGGDPAGGDSDLMTMTMPDIDYAADVIAGRKEGDIVPPTVKQPAKEPAKEPAKQKQTPPAKQQQQAPAKTPPPEPAAQLRQQLDAVKAERDTLKATLEKGDPRLVEVEKAVREKETALAESNKRIEEYERKLALSNPAVTKRLQEMDAQFDKAATKFYARVPEIDHSAIIGLVNEYAKLPMGKEGYREARQAFEEKVNQKLGAQDGAQHRKLDSVMDFIEKTADFMDERNTAQQEVHQNALKLQRESELGEFTKRREFVKTGLDRARTVPEDMAKTDPFHPKVVVSKWLEEMGDKAPNIDKGVPEFIELVMSGVKPRSPEDYVGMTPDQIAESQERETQQIERAREHAIDVMYNGLRALRLFPLMAKQISMLREKLGENSETVPDPTGGNGNQGNGSDDLKTFVPPDLANVTF